MKSIKNNRDKLYPGKVQICDLCNGRYITRKPIYDFLVEHSSEIEGELLDYGCGSMQYRSVFYNIERYTGLDIAGAEKNGFIPEKDVVYYDGIQIPFEDSKFDSAIAIEVFEHVENIEYGLQELSRVLKGEGVLLITVPMTFPLHLEPWDYRRFTFQGLKKVLEENGFRVIDIHGSTGERDTIRRLKIIEMQRRKSKFAKCYTIYANLLYILGKNKKSKDSKLPIDFLVKCVNCK